jgi:WD40 repeat protein
MSLIDMEHKSNHVTFNSDSTGFTVATDKGFGMYSCTPFEKMRHVYEGGAVGIVQPMFNIFAVVGSLKHPKYPSTKVMIYDDNQKSFIGEMSFKSQVRGVKLRRDKIVVILEEKIYIYAFNTLRLIDHIETTKNQAGLCVVTSNSECVLACPSIQMGYIRISWIDGNTNKLIEAHKGPISALALDASGERVATTSENGTIIRVFETRSGTLLHELRRGKDPARIYSLCFNKTGEHLLCSSDHGTIHIFSVKRKDIKDVKVEDVKDVKNTTSLLSFAGHFHSYFTSEWSFCQVRLPDGVKHVATFGRDDNIIHVICYDGSFYNIRYNIDGTSEILSCDKLIL